MSGNPPRGSVLEVDFSLHELEEATDRAARLGLLLLVGSLAAVTSDSAMALLDAAGAMTGLVAAAGGQHNLELSDRLIRDAVALARDAYGQAGMVPPPSPELGRVPHSGMCSYCHYGPEEGWDFRTMPEDFHQSVLTPRE